MEISISGSVGEGEEMRIFQIVCFICNQDGEPKPATHRYFAKGANDWYDVCDKHAKEVDGQGFEVEEISEGDRILEEWEI